MMNIYNNRLFKYLYSKEEEGYNRLLAKLGVLISDEEQSKKYIMSSTQFNFWIVLTIVIFIGVNLLLYFLK